MVFYFNPILVLFKHIFPHMLLLLLLHFNPILVLFKLQVPIFILKEIIYFNPILVLFKHPSIQYLDITIQNFNPILVLFKLILIIVGVLLRILFQSYISLIQAKLQNNKSRSINVISILY